MSIIIIIVHGFSTIGGGRMSKMSVSVRWSYQFFPTNLIAFQRYTRFFALSTGHHSHIKLAWLHYIVIVSSFFGRHGHSVMEQNILSLASRPSLFLIYKPTNFLYTSESKLYTLNMEQQKNYLSYDNIVVNTFTKSTLIIYALKHCCYSAIHT